MEAMHDVAPSARPGAARRVLAWTLLANLAVAAGKIVVGGLSGSLAMVADGYHSLVDGLNNVIGLFVVAWSDAPPDSDHPYGHGKFETVAAVAIGVTLAWLAYDIVADAFARIAAPATPEITPANWAVMIATIAINVAVSTWEQREGERLGSDFLIADAAQTRSDVYVSLAVIGSFAGPRAGLPQVDVAVALVVAVLVARASADVLLRSFHVLTDRAPLDSGDVARIVRAIPGVRGVAAVRSRGTHGAVYVDLTAEVDGDATLRAAHAIADRIEKEVASAFPSAVDVVVHLEPFAPRDER